MALIKIKIKKKKNTAIKIIAGRGIPRKTGGFVPVTILPVTNVFGIDTDILNFSPALRFFRSHIMLRPSMRVGEGAAFTVSGFA
jgi:hypothetical protein